MRICDRFTDKVILETEADLSEADLSEADLPGADLSEADLSRANLSGANLYRADLSRANLSGADLSGANLSEADLSRANLSEANLSRANLSEANLSEANLSGADLSRAIIKFCKFPSLRLLSSISLGSLPNKLTLELMRRDAYSHPHPELFDEWADGEGCPYKNEERAWRFREKRELWKSGTPEMADRDLIVAICKAKNWEI